MRSFEIQTFNDGKWKMDSVFDDRDLALHEAKKVDAAGRYAGVRVIEENYDEATNKVTNRTLFRGGAAKGQKALKPVSAAKSRQVGSRGGTGREPARKGTGKRHSKKSNSLVPVLVVLVVILAGLVVLLGLQYFSS
jgi:hypothetical protein